LNNFSDLYEARQLARDIRVPTTSPHISTAGTQATVCAIGNYQLGETWKATFSNCQVVTVK
jgi:hypothetical protein